MKELELSHHATTNSGASGSLWEESALHSLHSALPWKGSPRPGKRMRRATQPGLLQKLKLLMAKERSCCLKVDMSFFFGCVCGGRGGEIYGSAVYEAFGAKWSLIASYHRFYKMPFKSSIWTLISTMGFSA